MREHGRLVHMRRAVNVDLGNYDSLDVLADNDVDMGGAGSISAIFFNLDGKFISDRRV